MSDLISREVLIRALLSEEYSTHEYCFPCIKILSIIKELPSAQPEIIYCKDCKYNCFNAEAGIAKCCIFHAKTNLYGFCYLGERRTDE